MHLVATSTLRPPKRCVQQLSSYLGLDLEYFESVHDFTDDTWRVYSSCPIPLSSIQLHVVPGSVTDYELRLSAGTLPVRGKCGVGAPHCSS